MLLLALTAHSQGNGAEAQLARLDSCIQMKGKYDRQKEEKLVRLKREQASSSREDVRYLINYQLFCEYESYNFDSAYHYARQAADQAVSLNNRNYKAEAGCGIASCYLSAGLYKEAFDVMKMVDPSGTDNEYRKKYYAMWMRLYYDLANYNNSEPYESEYVRRGNLYVDTLLTYVEKNSVDWYYAQAQRQMKNHDFARCTETFKKIVQMKEASAHMRAIAYSCIGWSLYLEGKEDEAISNLAESAIYDIQESTKENTSTCGLATILYKRGDISRAVVYVQSSLADANFYGARHRMIAVGQILPIIEQDRYSLMERQRNLYILAIAIALLFIISLLTATLIIRRQVKKLNKARTDLNERNLALEQANQNLTEAQLTINERNEALQKANDRLEESNRIKTVYVGRSFYHNSEYINKVEKLYKMVSRKIAARQFEDLRSQLKESTLMTERINMYADFDETFLNLFPDFVDKFNQLFDEKDRKQPDGMHSLTNEMRIFALMRLGVSDSERIANFLNYSVHTVNTYKTRVKNKAIVDNEQFEKISSVKRICVESGIPIISIDTKRKEPIGNFKRQGTVLCTAAPKAFDHDFASFSDGIIVPHGIYDIARNTGYLTIGTSHDTSEFVCDNIEACWNEHLRHLYPDAEMLVILCDGGGSNSSSHHIVKQDLISLSDRIGLRIVVMHYPPYCSKYNPIEHRLFSQISHSWSGNPLLSVADACKRAAETVTDAGLKVFSRVVEKVYETGRKVSDGYREVLTSRVAFDYKLHKWNYLINHA